MTIVLRMPFFQVEVATRSVCEVETTEAGEGGVHLRRHSVLEPYRDAESHGSGGIYQSDAVCGDRTGRVW